MTSIRVVDIPKPWHRELPQEREGPLSERQDPTETLCRALNVTVAAVGLVAAAPVMFIIGLAIKLTSRGPIFYTQTRVGIDRRAPGEPAGNSRRHTDFGGKPFRIYKFRTMTAAAPSREATAEVWAKPDDPRVTTVGRILRLYRLDELPQLVNVLRGEMNVVGPRPEQPTIFARLREEIEGYDVRQRVRPGITGWAQINHSYDQTIEDVRRKLELDLEYIGRRSVLEDVRILVRTLPVMLGNKGGW